MASACVGELPADVLAKVAAAGWPMNMTPDGGRDPVEEGGLFGRETFETVDRDEGETKMNLACWEMSSGPARFTPVLLVNSAWGPGDGITAFFTPEG